MKLKNIFFLLVGLLHFVNFAEANMVQANGIEIFYETFGDEKNPAFLLIMGGGGQGVCWPKEFCQKLAAKGYYVIRYDQRDSGLSTCIDIEKNPYDLQDMAKDGLGLLDALHIEKAHLFGLSMGGPIAEIMSLLAPQKVESIAMMGSCMDYRPLNLALSGEPPVPG